MFVYLIVCSATLKIYVGQHKGTNLRQYLQQKLYESTHRPQCRSRLYDAMRTYGGWSIWPLVSGIQTRVELDELEKHYIRVLKTQHPDVGYNICRGGEGFTGPQSPKARALISASLRKQHENGDRMSPEGRAAVGAKNREHMLGTTQSEETCAKHRESTLQRQAAGDLPKGRTPGFHHSPETLAKMRESAKRHGCNWTPESHEKASAARKGKPWSARRRAAYLNKG